MTAGRACPSPRTVLESVITPLLARFPAPPLPFRPGAEGSGPQLIAAVANHLLAQSGWAMGRLRPYAGRSAQIVVGAKEEAAGPDTMQRRPLLFPFVIGADGLLHSSSSRDAAPDVTLHLPADALSAFPSGGLQAVMGRVQVSGAADLAETLGFVFRHLRWDGEADLARLLGDIPAHRLSLWAGQAWRWQKEASRRLLANGLEYLVEERGVVPSRQVVHGYAQEVDRLRDDLARLEKRLQRLTELAQQR